MKWNRVLSVYGNIVVLGSAVTLLYLMLCSATTPDFHWRIYTNMYNECYVEIVILVTGVMAFVYQLWRNRK